MFRKKPHSTSIAPKKPFDTPPNYNVQHDESNWLISYADMMTLLCGLFIMLFSMAKIDEPKYEVFKKAMSKQFGGDYVPSTQELAQFAMDMVRELGVSKSSIVKIDPHGIAITFESTIFFDTLSADISSEGSKLLKQFVLKVSERQKKTGKSYKIIAEGHTDGRPVTDGNYPSNWELSGARAASVIRLFLDAGFQPSQLTAIGYADTRPILPSRTASGTWDVNSLAKNRRVVLRLMEPSADSIPYAEGSEVPTDLGK